MYKEAQRHRAVLPAIARQLFIALRCNSCPCAGYVSVRCRARPMRRRSSSRWRESSSKAFCSLQFIVSASRLWSPLLLLRVLSPSCASMHRHARPCTSIRIHAVQCAPMRHTDKRLAGTGAVQTFIYQLAVLNKINRLTLKHFQRKHLLLCGFTFAVLQISPANTLYSMHVRMKRCTSVED